MCVLNYDIQTANIKGQKRPPVFWFRKQPLYIESTSKHYIGSVEPPISLLAAWNLGRHICIGLAKEGSPHETNLIVLLLCAIQFTLWSSFTQHDSLPQQGRQFSAFQNDHVFHWCERLSLEYVMQFDSRGLRHLNLPAAQSTQAAVFLFNTASITNWVRFSTHVPPRENS